MHQKVVGIEAEGSVTAGSLELLSKQAGDERVPRWFEVFRAWSLCQGTKKTGLERSYYRTVFDASEMVKRSVMNELELKARKMLKGRAVNAKATWYAVVQRAAAARLQSSVEYHEKVQYKC